MRIAERLGSEDRVGAGGDAAGANQAWIAGDREVLRAVLGEIPFARSGRIGTCEVTKHRTAVKFASHRNCSVHVHIRALAPELEEVDDVHHLVAASTWRNSWSACSNERHADSTLIRSRFRAQRIEWRTHGVEERAVVADNHNQSVRSIERERALLVERREIGREKHSTKLHIK